MFLVKYLVSTMMNVLILEEKEKIIQNPALYVKIYLMYVDIYCTDEGGGVLSKTL